LLEADGADVLALGSGDVAGRGAANGGYGTVDWTDTLKRPAEARANRQRFRKAIQPYLLHSERVMAHVAAAADAAESADAAAKTPGGTAGGAAPANAGAAMLAARKRALEASAMDDDLNVETKQSYQPPPKVARRGGGSGDRTGQPDEAEDGDAALVQSNGLSGNGYHAPDGYMPGPPRRVRAAVEAASRESLLAELDRYQHAERPPLLPKVALEDARAALSSIDLEESASAAAAAASASAATAIPEALRLDEHAARVHELLRHFWGCLNPRTELTDDKLRRLAPPLRNCYDELHSLKAALPADERKPAVAAAIVPLLAMIERSFALTPR
jgi:hypothetical protein